MRNRIFENPGNYTKEAMRERFRENYKRHKNKEPDEKSESLNYRTETSQLIQSSILALNQFYQRVVVEMGKETYV